MMDRQTLPTCATSSNWVKVFADWKKVYIDIIPEPALLKLKGAWTCNFPETVQQDRIGMYYVQMSPEAWGHPDMCSHSMFFGPMMLLSSASVVETLLTIFSLMNRPAFTDHDLRKCSECRKLPNGYWPCPVHNPA